MSRCSCSTAAPTAVDDEALRDCVIFGSERTMEQDPLFAFRILVDIAIKALSAAINDPTTAVLAIDQLHRLLRSAGRRNLRTDSILGPAGTLRVIFRTPDWDDFIHLAFAEIRFYGASNIQIARRLRAMIINLANTLARRTPRRVAPGARSPRSDAGETLRPSRRPRARAHPGLTGPRRLDRDQRAEMGHLKRAPAALTLLLKQKHQPNTTSCHSKL